MEQILAIAVIAFILYFAIRMGSLLWRVAGVLIVLYLVVNYHEVALNQLENFVVNPDFAVLWDKISLAASGIWIQVTGLFQGVSA
ncbi:hypothetical protein [Enterococcus sp. AZ103]|uniref:hypothetical protein n=1 Tax=Enterococcus sp. AZ103 TaxID=2774628 RepID=UPI003F1EA67B